MPGEQAGHFEIGRGDGQDRIFDGDATAGKLDISLRKANQREVKDYEQKTKP